MGDLTAGYTFSNGESNITHTKLNSAITDSTVVSASASTAGKVELATNAETQAGSDATRAVTPAGLASMVASESLAGLAELATTTEAKTGTDTGRIVTPAGLAAYGLQEHTSSVGNVGAGEDTLWTYTVPAATLNETGRSISFELGGVFAANANNKRIRVKFGAGPTTLIDTGAVAVNGGDWSIRGTIMRSGTATQRCVTTWISSNATLAYSSDYVAGSETNADALTFLVTGEATSDNDVELRFGRIWLNP